MMKTILIDASSAILLYKADAFSTLIHVYDLRMTPSVFTELTREGYLGTEVFKRCCNRVTRWEGSAEGIKFMPDGFPPLPHLGNGERDTIGQYLQGIGNFIIMDDGRAAAYCRDNSIPYINALLFPRILYLSGILSQTEYRRKVDILIQVGRYSKKIIEYANHCGLKDVEFFLP
ncbi:hypothetical protein [Desulforhabdus amnigena]|nr:hypothetical protein [Desulforhabdus amnigena]NLJ29191.1 hypothetical protein [Deltaproteobacteria bacterium]